ncbi:MAG: peptidoglycan-associated lipoprotein Pal [Deltaproteobacteria bacterium]|nr:MAG: peptidoglycan-associated lipoprotein Pal [Deltaproteobacteria bacterium]
MKAAKVILALALFASLMFVFTSCTCKPELEEEKVAQPAALATPAAVTPAIVKPATISTGVVTIGDRVVDIGDHVFPIYFDYDKAALRSDARETLGKLAQWLKINPEIGLRIDGHCDERGSNEYNLALGETRAASAQKYLVYLGISPEHFETLSYGEEKPVCSESNESCWSQNRRVEFTITAK